MFEIENINKILNESPSLELLQTKHRNLTIPFFVHAFKKSETSHSQKVFESILVDYLQHINYIEESEDLLINTESLEIKAKRKIKEWRGAGFLNQYIIDDGTILYDLSQYSLRSLDWIADQKRTEFVGTDSKFKSVYEKIKDILEYTDDNLIKRKQILEERKLTIQHQIDQLEAGEAVLLYDEREIIEHFQDLLRTAKDLLIDFNEVEENFIRISKDVYSKYSSNQLPKEEILNLTFTALQELKNSNQGKSFYAFWKFLLDTDYQEDWSKLTNELYSRLEQKNIPHEDTFLKNLKQNLNQAALKVTGANTKMASKVARIIRDSGTNQKITKQLLSDIKKLLSKISKQSIVPDIGIELDAKPVFILPLEPGLTSKIKEEIIYTKRPVTADDDHTKAKSINTLYENSGIDRLVLRKRIADVIKDKDQTTLEEIINIYGGIKEGLPELFGYIGELKKFKHNYNTNKDTSIVFDKKENKTIKIPEIILVR